MIRVLPGVVAASASSLAVWYCTLLVLYMSTVKAIGWHAVSARCSAATLRGIKL